MTVTPRSGVTFVVPTKNSAQTLERCLRSIRNQQAADVELIVVDNHSTDSTRRISESYSDLFVLHGPERSGQRNRGAALASHDLIVFIDSDMVLDPGIALELLTRAVNEPNVAAWVIPERVGGRRIWERARSIEKSAYLNDERIEAARAFRRCSFEAVRGYNEALCGVEDWDLPDRIRAHGGSIGRLLAGIEHDERNVTIVSSFRKKRYYGRSVAALRADRRLRGRLVRSSLLRAVALGLVRDPVPTAALVVLKTVEFAGIALGVLDARRSAQRHDRDGSEGSDLHKYAARGSEATALVITHEHFEDGSAHALAGHLAHRSARVTLVALPFPDAPDPRIRIRNFDSGRSTERRLRVPPLLGRFPFSLACDAAVGAWFVYRRRNADLVVAVDPFNASVVLGMRLLRIHRADVVFYSIDFVPQRFPNPMLNRAYHAVDAWCARRADVVWNVSPAIHEGRVRMFGDRRWAPKVVVPIGIHHLSPRPLVEPRPRLVFLGHLLEKQGLQYALPALAALAGDFPAIRLDVIGAGPYEEALRSLAREHNVEERVRFLGYEPDPMRINQHLHEGGIALAPYTDDSDSFTRFADPSKIKAYLAAALPIVVTDVPLIATELEERGACIVVEPDARSIERAIRLLLDPATYAVASAAALDFARDFRWGPLFDAALPGGSVDDRKR